MIPELKTWVGSIDSKRLYTGLSVVAVSGVAAHFMQNDTALPGYARLVNQPASIAIAIAAPQVTAVVDTAATVPTALAEELALAEAATALDDPRVSEPIPAAQVTRGEASPSHSLLTAAYGAETGAKTNTNLLFAPLDAPALTASEADCPISLTATPVEAAIVTLTLAAPCHSGEAVTFASDGLSISEYLDPTGQLDLLFPPLSEQARISAIFADGTERSVEIELPDFKAFRRVALTWQGDTGLQLHVFENSAGYDDPGHIWAENPNLVDMALAGSGGFVTVLGSVANGGAADVYTYPAALDAGVNPPDVSVELAVADSTCGTKVEGHLLNTGPDQPTDTPLSIAMPGCDAVGEYLVLKNLSPDLKLAAE